MDSMASASRIDDLYVAPYDAFDPKNEPHPDHVIYQPEFRDLRSLQKHVIALFLETLSASKYHNPTTRILLELVRKIDKGDNAEQTMFAVCGNMGLGKSSVTTSLATELTVFRQECAHQLTFECWQLREKRKCILSVPAFC